MADLSQKLLGAGAAAKNDWAHASAETGLNFTGRARFRRGIEVEIGLDALATADAGLSKFVDASIRGNAFAEARASLQLQLPLNLFDEFGLAVGAQAVAQAAAGIEVGLAAIAGDIIELVAPNRDSAGLPLDLLLLLLDEAELGGHFEIHVAASAMAYASLTITGELVNDPGFHYNVDGGVGLAAGFGFSGGLDVGLRDFRRFYGRAVDLTLTSVGDGLADLLRDERPELVPVVRAMAPVAATALRVAYELGYYIAKNQPGRDRTAALTLSNHCVGIVLEEAQRFLFRTCIEAGLERLRKLVTDEVPALAAGVWDGLRPERSALADALRRMPNDPFQPTEDNAAYWAELLDAATALIAGLAASASRQGHDADIRGLSMIFAAVKLLTQAIRTRINHAEAYAFAIGAGGASTPAPQPFTGAVEAPPAPDKIREHINQSLGRGSTAALTYPVLVSFLVSDGVIPLLRGVSPAVDEFLGIFRNQAVSGTLSDVVRALVTNKEAFVTDSRGDRDPQQTLRALLGALSAFIDIKIQEQLVAAVQERVADASTKTYFDEVIVATLIFTKDVAFKTVLDWEKSPIDQATFTEALSSVLTMLLGRSLVMLGDGFATALQAEMAGACEYAANHFDGGADPFSTLNLPASPELRSLFVEMLRGCKDVFGPLPEDTRTRLRFVLYDAMETLPPSDAEQADLVTNLADQFFIPNKDSLEELADELLAIARDRFGRFAERMLTIAGDLLLATIEEAIEDAIHAVEQWVADIERRIARLAAEAAALARAVELLLGRARKAFDDAVEKMEALLETFARPSLRNRLRHDIRDKLYGAAKDILRDNGFYHNLPAPVKRFARGVLKDAVTELIEGPILDPIFAALGSVAGELDGLLDDVQDLDPDQPLAPQLLDLTIDRMEDRIRDAFGGTSPRISVGFRIDAFGFAHHFHLGTVQLSFAGLLSVFRACVRDLDFYDDALADAAAAVSEAFRRAIAADAKTRERDAASAAHARLAQIRAEFTSSPKTVTIVNPASLAAYDGDVDVEISLGGVPPSYLGLAADEQPRVIVLLNGGRVPLQDVNVSSAITNPVAPQPSGPLLQAPLRAVVAARGARATSPIARQVLRPSGSATGGRAADALVTRTTVENIAPGRRMTPTKRRAIGASQPPGTSLGWRLPREQLVAGANTLAVVVIDPGGQRYQHVVSFTASAPPPAPRPGLPDRVKLPAVPGHRVPGPPIQPLARVSPSFDRAALAQRVTTGVRLLAARPREDPQ